jgi:cytochrome c oxidase subunit II
MDTSFRFFPQSASTTASSVDHLYTLLVLVSLTMVVLIFFSIFVFAIKYRRRPGNEVARQIHGNDALEIGWSVVPLIILLGIFFWGAKIYFHNANPPANASPIYVVGKQWMWKIQHPEGPREIDALHIPVGRPIKLIMTSEDVIHSFFVPAFRVKQDVLPGRYTQEWFQATKTGEYHLFCAEYCGTNHSHMIGTVYVMDPTAYQRWLSGSGDVSSMAASGEKLFHRLGCATCHVRDCPPMQGLYMSRVPLNDGTTVVANDDYLRRSIIDPTAQIVSGYTPKMPTYKGQISEEGILQILTYIHSLAGESPGAVNPGSGAAAPTNPAGGQPQ